MENFESLEEVVNFIANPKYGQLALVCYTYKQVGVLEQFRKFTRAPSMNIVIQSLES
jgi:hypothetical protein